MRNRLELHQQTFKSLRLKKVRPAERAS